ncbi:hypothetical protein BLNAU_4624 [Blattamonas nauphoetae]|uniref:Uncharacterized protein n=1 Tax=Blattamonas nauphoetae TaxID=2049346 RepID=A0ABQ9Y9G4_9EUKA|nr:hypothetical protein BLNAU_4624 [Blattamonas nauphoetae]
MTLVALFLIGFSGCEETLKGLYILQKHGDMYGTMNFTGGPTPSHVTLGMITEKGQKRAQATAKFLAQQDKYKALLTRAYDYNQFSFYSTFEEHSKMSSLAFTNGLFAGKGPKTDDGKCIFTDKCNQPVPLVSVMEKNEYLLKAYNNCPVASAIMNKKKGSKEFKKLMKDNAVFLKTVAKAIELKINNDNVLEVLETLKCNAESEIALPASLVGKEQEITQLFYKLSLAEIPRDDQSYCHASLGAFMREIVSNMNADIKAKDPIVHHYSTDGEFMEIFLDCYDIPFTDRPEYAAMIVFELWSEGDASFVRFFSDLKPALDGTSDLKAVKPNVCSSTEKCPISEFSKGYETVIGAESLTEWFYNECGYRTTVNNVPILILDIVLAVLFVVALVIAIIALWSLCRQTKKMQL